MFSSQQDAVDQVQRATESPGLAHALKLAEGAVHAFPDSADVRACYSEALLSCGRLEEAKEQADQALGLDPGSRRAMAAQMHLDCFVGDLESARLIVDKLDDGEPGDLDEFVIRAEYHLLAGNGPEGVGLMKRIRTDFPDNPRALRLVVLWPGVPAEIAAESRAQLLARFPDSFDACLQLGREAKRDSDLTRAESLLKAALVIAPESDTALVELADTQFRLAKFAEAEDSANAALALNARHPGALNRLSEIAKEQGNSAVAASYAKRAIEAVPGLKALGVLRNAAALKKAGKHEMAAQQYETLVTGPSAMGGFAVELAAMAYLNAGKWSDVERMLALVLPERMDTDLVIQVRAGLADAQKNPSEAIAILESGLERNPRNGNLALALLQLLHKQGQKEKASALVTEFADEPPSTPAGCMGLYAIFDTLGYKKEAAMLLAKSRELFPDYSAWRLVDAIGHLESGQFDKAIETGQTIHGDRADLGSMVTKAGKDLKTYTNPLYWLRRKKRDD